jgi:hypothetical protein
MYPEVYSGCCKIVTLPISRVVFLVRMPIFVEVVGSREWVRTRQVVISGVYNGVPGFGFKRARYFY